MAEELTPEQIKQRRNEYARAYYAKNKDKMKAKAGKKTDGVDKKTEKLAAKGAKTLAAAKEILVSAAAVIDAAYKTGDQKLVDHTSKLFKKQFGLAATHNLEDGTVSLTLDVGVKKVRLPKEFVKQARQPDEGEDMEVAMDPDLIKAIQEGANPEDVLPPEDEEAAEDEFDEENEDDDENIDEDEETAEDDDWDEDLDRRDSYGREEMFREMEAMGVGEEDM